MSFEFNGSTENVYCPIELLPHNESLPPAPVQEVTSLDLSMADYPPPNETPNQSGLFTSTQIIDPSRLQNAFIDFNVSPLQNNEENMNPIPIFQVVSRRPDNESTLRNTTTSHHLESSLGFMFDSSSSQDTEVLSPQSRQGEFSVSFLFNSGSSEIIERENSGNPPPQDGINFNLGVSEIPENSVNNNNLPSYEVPEDLNIGRRSPAYNESLSFNVTESDDSHLTDTEPPRIIMSYFLAIIYLECKII